MTLQQKLTQADDYLDMLKDKAKETDELAKENLRLRKKLDTAINVIRKSDRKIERLNNIINGLDNTIKNLEEVAEHKINIINELEKWCDENYYEDAQYGYDLIDYSYLKDKIKELKGEDE